MPLVVLRSKPHYATGLSVAVAPPHPLSLVTPHPELRPAGLRTD
jgi:hypothetical protein